MSTHTIFAPPSLAVPDAEKNHSLRVTIASMLILALFAGMAVYGWDYYTMGTADRPYSSKHHALRPSGSVGIGMGLLGVSMFCTIFLYPLRKRWRWLQKRGSSKHWLDYHSLLGSAAPVCIAFHSSFKFQGMAGVAFWIMVAVAISGFVGRYLYAQIPRRVTTAELSMKESREMLAQMADELRRQDLILQEDLQPLFHLPSAENVARWPLLDSLGYMVMVDMVMPFRVARLRLKAMGAGLIFTSVIGLFPGSDTQIERVIDLARRQASLSKRIIFLSHAQRVFQLWHVIHRPFSYSFAVLAILHITVAMVLGFM